MKQKYQLILAAFALASVSIVPIFAQVRTANQLVTASQIEPIHSDSRWNLVQTAVLTKASFQTLDCPIARRNQPSLATQHYTIIESDQAVCVYAGRNLAFSERELRSLRYLEDSESAGVWLIHEDHNNTIVHLVSSTGPHSFSFPNRQHSWVMSNGFIGGKTSVLNLRRTDGGAIRTLVFSAPDNQVDVFERESSPSEYFEGASPLGVSIVNLCDWRGSQNKTERHCLLKNNFWDAPYYEVGECGPEVPPVIYVQGGPLTPTYPLQRYEKARQLLFAKKRPDQSSAFCVWLPVLATSSDRIVGATFGESAAEAETQVLQLAVKASEDFPKQRLLVVAESFGTQALRSLLASNLSIDLVFFSGLLNEREFAESRGAIVSDIDHLGLNDAQKDALRESVTAEMRTKLLRPSNQRFNEYFLWLETIPSPILTFACSRRAPLRIVIVRAESDTISTPNETDFKVNQDLCANNGHELDEVVSGGRDHATFDLAVYAAENSLLLNAIRH